VAPAAGLHRGKVIMMIIVEGKVIMMIIVEGKVITRLPSTGGKVIKVIT
jgi:hypothetical protein